MPAKLILACLLSGCWAAAAAGEGQRSVELRSPLTTVVAVELPGPVRTRAVQAIEAEVVVPADAPADLGVGCFVADVEGTWYQSLHPRPLPPGRHRLRFAIDGEAPLVAEGHQGRWSAYQAILVARAGLFFWSASGSRARVQIDRLAVLREPAASEAKPAYQLLDLAPGSATPTTGTAWTLRCRPEPFPRQPFQAERFALTLEITDPAGGVVRLDGFYREPMQLLDRGDTESALPGGDGEFAVRWWPRLPGVHRLRLLAAWDGEERIATRLPDALVSGPAWNDYVRVDAADHRFFSAGGRWFWPIGVSLVMITDERAQEAGLSRPTPDRRFHAYEAYLRRFAAAGVDLVQVWMANWSFSLEWSERWPGQRGQGHYSQANAERLDRLLDLAGQLGMRVNVVLYHHGQASTRYTPEWENNPYNSANAGPLTSARQVFTDDRMRLAQERLQHYIRARWGGHPAVFAWELWSEPQGCDARGEQVVEWHQAAAARWRARDPDGRLISTYAGGFSFNWPAHELRSIPQLDHVVDSGYRPRNADRRQSVAELLWQHMTVLPDQYRRYDRPVLISEYGGNFMGSPDLIDIDHRMGAWSALVSGYAAAPLLWWHEWVDQNGRWDPYRAIRAFIAGEDLRGASLHFVQLPARAEAGRLWSAAALRPGRALGYVVDLDWARSGGKALPLQTVRVTVGEQVQPGRLQIEWWDADNCRMLERTAIDHAGGALVLAAPAFRYHLAFKLYRAE